MLETSLSLSFESVAVVTLVELEVGGLIATLPLASSNVELSISSLFSLSGSLA